ncbi:hypothetical protein B0H19DRAFT_1072930 [Mycena capillaripes]|nr:hypothetical protein B0H19DRAFT_1072930 [Mycena capillaripes]
MKRAFEDTRKQYDKALDAHLLNYHLEPDSSIWKEFKALEKAAEELGIAALKLNNPPILRWWNEFIAIFKGDCTCRAIVKCTWRIEILKREIQLIAEIRAHDLNAASSRAGLSPAQQRGLRRQNTFDSGA